MTFGEVAVTPQNLHNHRSLSLREQRRKNTMYSLFGVREHGHQCKACIRLAPEQTPGGCTRGENTGNEAICAALGNAKRMPHTTPFAAHLLSYIILIDAFLEFPCFAFKCEHGRVPHEPTVQGYNHPTPFREVQRHQTTVVMYKDALFNLEHIQTTMRHLDLSNA